MPTTLELPYKIASKTNKERVIQKARLDLETLRESQAQKVLTNLQNNIIKILITQGHMVKSEC